MEDTLRLWSKETIAVVTGGNKGIGYEIVRGLAKQGVTTVLTARDETRGREALQSLKQNDGVIVHFHKLDVTSLDSVKEFAAWLKSQFGGLDILVNNAGLAMYSHDLNTTKLEAAKALFNTNYYGVRRVTEQLIPLLKPSVHGARIINISSSTSRLDSVTNKELRERLSNVDGLSTEAVDQLVESYLEDVEHDRVAEKGWPGFFNNYDYCASKVLLNAYARVVARDLEAMKLPHKIFINCICPGLTSTDMTLNSGHSAEVGADTAVWLALLPASDCTSGQFFMKRTSVGFVSPPFYGYNVFTTSYEELEAAIKSHQPNITI